MTKKIFYTFIFLFTLALMGCAKPGQKPAIVPPKAQEQAAVNLQETIRVMAPKTNSIVQSPLEVTGEARGTWYFEADFPVELWDSAGNQLATATAQAKSDWMTEDYVPFSASLQFVTDAKAGVLILKKSNPSGLPENDDQISIPVKFGQGDGGQENVNIFFSNEVLDPEVTCEKVFPVTRSVVKADVMKATLEELLKGPTEAEKGSKYSTALNKGVTLKSLTIKDGVATADFDEQLGFQVGGSCRVGLIRKQIEETLRQFPEVKTVKIAINGASDDTILQP